MYSNIKKSPNNPLIIRSLRAIQSQKPTIQHLSLKFYQKSFAMSQKIRTFAPVFLREFQNHKIFTNNNLINFKKSKYLFNMKIFKKILIAVTLATVLMPWNCANAQESEIAQWQKLDGTWYVFYGHRRSWLPVLKYGIAGDVVDNLGDMWYFSDETNVYVPNANSVTNTIIITPDVVRDLGNLACRYYVYVDNTSVMFDTWRFSPGGEKTYSSSLEITKQRTTFPVSFGWYSLSLKAKEMTFNIELPKHFDYKDNWGTLTNHQFNPITKGGVVTNNTWTFDFNSYIRSYYLEDGITFELQTSNGGAYVGNEFTLTTGNIAAGTVYADGVDCFNDKNKKIGSAHNVTVKYTPDVNVSGSRLIYLVIKNGDNEIKKIALSGDVRDKFYIVMDDKEIIDCNTATYNYQLQPDLKSIWYTSEGGGSETTLTSGVTYSYSIVGQNDGISCGSTSGVIAARKVGTYVIRVHAEYDRPSDQLYTYDLDVPVYVVRGTLVFNNAANDNDWFNSANWWPHNLAGQTPIVPDFVNHNVDIQAPCVVSGTAYANCYDCNITGSGNLTINSDGKLYVANTLTGSTTDAKITIKTGDSENNRGSLVCVNPASAAKAHVELFVPKASIVKPTWRYMGMPVQSGSIQNVSFIYVWDNNDNHDIGNGVDDECWNYTGGTQSAWEGYAVAKAEDIEDVTYIEGNLVFGDYTFNIRFDSDKSSEGSGTVTTVHPDDDMNLITNSYSAPIIVSKLRESDFVNTQSMTMYFFNDGTHQNWLDKAAGAGFNTGSDPGQFKSLTPGTANAFGITEIPSGESFYIRGNLVKEQNQDEEWVAVPSAFNFRYATVLPDQSTVLGSNSGASSILREPETFNILEIIVKGDSLSDRVFLLENENHSDAFDNGYDGIKLLGVEGTPQIYATNDFGRTSINVDNTVTGQYIGFMAGKNGVHYTISFNTDRFEGYESLYLYDTMTGKYVNILEGETYTFTGKRSGEEKRFLIVGKHDVEADEQDDNTIFDRTGDDKKIDIFGNQALVSGLDDVEETVIISDMSGRTWWQSSTALGPWFDIPDLPSGIYIMSVGKCETKFIR